MDASHTFFWIQVIFGIVLLMGAQYAVKRVIRLMSNKDLSDHDWRLQLRQIIQPPLTLLLWTIGTVYVIDVIGQRLDLSIITSYLHPFRKAMVIISLVWLLFRWKKEFEKSLSISKGRHIDATTIEMVGRLVTVAIGIVGGLIILQTFGVNTAPLLAFGSIGAASLGFAGKDVIANFCSGLLMHLTRPFVIGDEIYLPEKQLQGVIEEIGWFKTSIRDKEKRAVYLPNNFFSTMLLINVTRMTHRRFKQTLQIYLHDTAKIDRLVKRIKSFLAEEGHLDASLPIHVFFQSLDNSCCHIEIDGYSRVTNLEKFNQLQHELLLGIQRQLTESQIELASQIIVVKQACGPEEAHLEQEFLKR